jgi:hypothetical protein
LHAGLPDESLVSAFLGRITASLDVMPNELDRVRYMSAVSLARMQATSALPAMRELLEMHGRNAANAPATAARWLLRELTGEMFPDPDHAHLITDWFLEPLAKPVGGQR